MREQRAVEPADRWGERPASFDRKAAEAVYKALLDMDDDSALIFGRMLVAKAMQHEVHWRRGEISKAVDAEVEQRSGALRRRLARTAVAKTRSGDDASVEMGVLAEIHKAFDFSTEQRRHYAEGQRRDLRTGRFAESHVKIGYDAQAKPLKREHAAQFGIPAAPAGMSGADAARFQQAYVQIAELIAPYARMPAGEALLHLNVSDKDGNEREVVAGLPGQGQKIALGQHVKQGQHVSSAAVSVVPSTTAGGAMYDALQWAGAPRAGATAAGMTEGGALDAERLGQFRNKLGENYEQDDYIPSARAFRSIGHGSKLISDSLGDAAPRKVKYALAVGEHIGNLGPEAQKVLGPTADRAAYRYRGTERTPDRRLGNALESIRRDPNLGTPADKREHMLHGAETDTGWNPSGVLSYFRRELPDVNLNTLQLKSGTVPPSKGIIIDARGQVAHESVGYGDDWYLPFNLRNLKKLKGGEYIRTRTWGGPTTEDLYTGLMSGARAMTVVSHNGVYTIDFDDTLRGGRRFNDKANRMVGRYGHLLDAVRSGQVETGGIHPSRLDELRDQASGLYDQEEEPERFHAEFERLKTRERRDPTLSHAQQSEATLEFFNDLASRQGDGSKQVTNPDELVRAFAVEAANRKYSAAAATARAGGFGDQLQADPEFSLDAYTRRELDSLRDGDAVVAGQKVADALGVRPALDAALARAGTTNRASLTALQLNGEGYKVALDALKEQFPYYIDRVEFHPWTDARPGRDTGYVRPRHSRPAEALSGYFDTLVSRTGQGKVHADSTRWQNRNRVLRPYVPEGRKARADAETTPGPAKTAELDPQVSRLLRDDADRALFQAIQAQTAFGPAVQKAPGHAQLNELSNLAIADFRDQPELASIAPNLVNVLRLTPADFDTALATDRDRMHGILAQAHGENRKTQLLDLPPEAVRTFESDGRPKPRREMSEHAAEALGDPHAEFDLDHVGRAYSMAAEPTGEQVAAAYAGDRSIERLVKDGRLPEDVGDPHFRSLADPLLAELRQKRSELLGRVARSGYVPTESDYRAIDRPTEGLVRALQLRRRHDEAVGRETRVEYAGSAAEEPATQQTVQFVLPPPAEGQGPTDYADYMEELTRRALGAGSP